MKKQTIQAALLLLSMFFITSCATSRLSWVKTHPASVPSVTLSKETSKQTVQKEATTASVQLNEYTQVTQNADAKPVPTTTVEKKTTVQLNHKIITNAVQHKKKYLNGIAQKAILKHINPTAGPLSDMDPDLRTAILLIVIGLILSLFWFAPGIGFVIGVIAEICLLIGLILLVVYLLS